MRVLPLIALVVVSCGGARASVDTRIDGPSSAKADPAAAAASEPAAPPEPPARKISFTVKPLAPGLTWTSKSAWGVNLVGAARTDQGAVMVDALGSVIGEERCEIVETDGKSLQKLKVTVIASDRTFYANGRVQRAKQPLVGRTYVLAMRPDGVLVITNDKGGRVTKTEGDALAAAYRPYFLQQAFGERPGGEMTVGASADGVIPLLRDLVASSGGDVHVNELSAKLIGTREDKSGTVAFFAVRVDETMRMEGGLIRSVMEGELGVRPSDGLPVVLTLAGPLAFGVDPKLLRAGGDGNMRGFVSFTW